MPGNYYLLGTSDRAQLSRAFLHRRLAGFRTSQELDRPKRPRWSHPASSGERRGVGGHAGCSQGSPEY